MKISGRTAWILLFLSPLGGVITWQLTGNSYLTALVGGGMASVLWFHVAQGGSED
jgi:hypothetical protein